MTDIPPDTGPTLYHNVFLALLPDSPTITNLQRALSTHKIQQSDCLLVDDWHMTLAFIGDITARGRQNLTGLIQSLAWVEPPPMVRLDTLGAFPSDSPTACAAFGIAGEALNAWQASIYSGVSALGYTLDKRPFVPHVTVKRDCSGERQPLIDVCIPFTTRSVALLAKADASSKQRYKILSEGTLLAL